jgi:tetratricopeptide (TPR) repeat protein
MLLSRSLCSFVCVATISGWATAVRAWQSTAESSSSIRGEVTWEGKTHGDSVSVELVSGDRIVNRSAVMQDGRFELAGVPAGNYEIRVADPLETILQRQLISVRGYVDGVKFKIESPIYVRPAAGTVTRNRLLRQVPGAARKEFERGGKAALKGLIEESIQHLRKALAIYPDYMEVHNDLGVRYLQRAEFAPAAVEFKAAIKLEPGAAGPVSNLALAWLALRRYNDAEFAAKRALALDPGFRSAQQVLRLVLARVAIIPNPTNPPELLAALGAR